jgi:hypothetical protein
VLAGVLCLACMSPAAAAPTLTYLFPAGAQRGTTVEVTAGGTFPHWPVHAWSDDEGISVKAASAKGKLSISVAADVKPGAYWIRLYDDQGASSLRPFLVGNLPEVLEQEPNDDPRKPQVLDSSSVTINGRLSKPEDVDGYAVKLRKGQTLIASLEANRTLGSPIDALLQIVSADGFVLEQNHDYHDLDPQIVFTVPKDGTYLVRTFGFPAVPDAAIRFTGSELCIYRLTLTTGAFVDHAYPLAVARSHPGQVELVGWNIPAEARKFAVGVNNGRDEAILSDARLANSVSVRLEPHATAVKVEPNDRQHPQPVTLPITITGRLDPPGQIDVFEFSAHKGQKLSFQLESRGLAFPLDAVLRLTDEEGKRLAQNGVEGGRRAPITDPTLTFTVPKDGAYRLEVSDLYREGGLRYVYRLMATLAEPAFELTLAADHFEMKPGQPLNIPVTVERRNGFDQPIEFTVEGLPEGVTVAPMKSMPTGASAKSVTLRLTAGAGPASVPIRVVGRTPGHELVRTARASIAGFNASTTHFWLTVPMTAKGSPSEPRP